MADSNRIILRVGEEEIDATDVPCVGIFREPSGRVRGLGDANGKDLIEMAVALNLMLMDRGLFNEVQAATMERVERLDGHEIIGGAEA